MISSLANSEDTMDIRSAGISQRRQLKDLQFKPHSMACSQRTVTKKLEVLINSEAPGRRGLLLCARTFGKNGCVYEFLQHITAETQSVFKLVVQA